jgi:pimeloyl-ACP methyl ester carboxylesterase
VLVHGLFADGSSWSEVIPLLQAQGLNVTSVQNPLTSLDDAVAASRRVLDRRNGPTVLAGHFFAGMIMTEGGVHPAVSALVYVAARAPDAGEDYAALAARFPAPPAWTGIAFDWDEGRLTEEAFLRDFAGDLPPARDRALFAVQQPFRKSILTGRPSKPHGAPGLASMPCSRKTGSSTLTYSATWRPVCAPRQLKFLRVISTLISHPQEISKLILDSTTA